MQKFKLVKSLTLDDGFPGEFADSYLTYLCLLSNITLLMTMGKC